MATEELAANAAEKGLVAGVAALALHRVGAPGEGLAALVAFEGLWAAMPGQGQRHGRPSSAGKPSRTVCTQICSLRVSAATQCYVCSSADCLGSPDGKCALWWF